MKSFSGLFCRAFVFLGVWHIASCDVLDNFAKSYRLQLTVDGRSYRLGNDIEGCTVRNDSPVATWGNDSVAITYRAEFASINSPQAYRICFERRFLGTYDRELAAFHGLFPTGGHAFAPRPDTTGVRIWWRDPGGTVWDSALGPQADGYFELTESRNEDDYWEKENAKRQELRGRFRCTLYNAAGAKKTVEEADFGCFLETSR
jgi:hypothetical protein